MFFVARLEKPARRCAERRFQKKHSYVCVPKRQILACRTVANSLVTNHMSVPSLRDGRGDQAGSARSAIATVTASSVLAASPVKSSAPIATVAATVVATPSAPVVAAVAAKHTIPVVDAELQPQAKRPKGFTLSEQAFDAAVLTSDPAMQSRMESLLKEVCLLAQALAAPVW